MGDMMPSFGALRLGLAILLALAGLLAVVKPPSYSFWKLSIIVMEGGHWMVLPCALLAWLSFRAGASGRIAGQLFLVAGVLFGLTAFRAWRTGAALAEEFSRTWKAEGAFSRTAPVQALDLFRGIPVPRARIEDFVYARRGDRELKLDFYRAQGPSPAPCVVLVHGGGWDSGDRGQLPDLNFFLAGRGYAVATLEYRLAPAHTYPAPVEDMREALAWLKAHADTLGIDPGRFVLMGRSAGGQIALQAAYVEPDPAVKGVIAFYAPADMVFGYSLPTNPLIMDSRDLMVKYLGGPYETHPQAYTASSPVEHLSGGTVPTLLLHGRPDVLVSFRHTVHMRERLGPLGVRHFAVDLPWAAHGFDYVFRGPGSQISLYFIERFLAEVV